MAERVTELPTERDAAVRRDQDRRCWPRSWAACRDIGWDVVDGYRLRSRHGLVTGQRAVLYTLFGYAIAAQGPVGLLVVNAAVMALVFMFFGAFDNYWDWRLLNEQNGTRDAIERRGFSPAIGLLLTCLPWLLIVPLMALARAWGMSPQSEIVFWLMVFLGVAYMAPGIRLKGRPLDFFVAPVWACLLFAQGYTLGGRPWAGVSLWIMCGTVFLLQCQAELLHRVDESLPPSHGVAAGPSSKLLRRLRWLPLWSLALSLGAASVRPWVLNTALWSLVRLCAVWRLEAGRVSVIRRQLWHPVWSLYEFAIYALLAWLHLVP